MDFPFSVGEVSLPGDGHVAHIHSLSVCGNYGRRHHVARNRHVDVWWMIHWCLGDVPRSDGITANNEMAVGISHSSRIRICVGFCVFCAGRRRSMARRGGGRSGGNDDGCGSRVMISDDSREGPERVASRGGKHGLEESLHLQGFEGCLVSLDLLRHGKSIGRRRRVSRCNAGSRGSTGEKRWERSEAGSDRDHGCCRLWLRLSRNRGAAIGSEGMVPWTLLVDGWLRNGEKICLAFVDKNGHSYRRCRADNREDC